MPDKERTTSASHLGNKDGSPRRLPPASIAEMQNMIQKVFEESRQETKTHAQQQLAALEAKRTQEAAINASAVQVAHYIDRLRHDLQIWEDHHGKHDPTRCSHPPCFIIKDLLKLRVTIRVEEPLFARNRLGLTAATEQVVTPAGPEWGHYIRVSLLKQFYNSVGEVVEQCRQNITNGGVPAFMVDALKGVQCLAMYCKAENNGQGELAAGREMKRLTESN
ncbi:hypothetical protein BJ165DRAFT_1489434 [Panaeolus papilionaceus]|nr:hypothetical protein BJ165DRAFT_1489434 [Panaeolus papilionaceus]